MSALLLPNIHQRQNVDRHTRRFPQRGGLTGPATDIGRSCALLRPTLGACKKATRLAANATSPWLVAPSGEAVLGFIVGSFQTAFGNSHGLT